MKSTYVLNNMQLMFDLWTAKPTVAIQQIF